MPAVSIISSIVNPLKNILLWAWLQARIGDANHLVPVASFIEHYSPDVFLPSLSVRTICSCLSLHRSWTWFLSHLPSFIRGQATRIIFTLYLRNLDARRYSAEMGSERYIGRCELLTRTRITGVFTPRTGLAYRAGVTDLTYVSSASHLEASPRYWNGKGNKKRGDRNYTVSPWTSPTPSSFVANYPNLFRGSVLVYQE